jgi:hypothetical protein
MKVIRQGVGVLGFIAMLNLLLVPVILAEEPTTGEQAPHVLLKTKFGEMEIVLFPDLAPILGFIMAQFFIGSFLAL